VAQSGQRHRGPGRQGLLVEDAGRKSGPASCLSRSREKSLFCVQRLTASVFAFVALALVVAGSAPSRATGRVVDVDFRSVAVDGTLRLAVYLPPGYERSGLRYPVVYFLHGLPASSSAYRGIDFLRRALEQSGRGALIVAPQGARSRDTDPEYLDWGPGRRWETATAREVPAYVDGHFRTIHDRRARATLRGRLRRGAGRIAPPRLVFGDRVVERVLPPHGPAGDARARSRIGHPQRTCERTRLRLSLRRAFARRPTFFGFYVGRGDDRFRDENEQLHRELGAARVAHVFHVYSGGHEQTVWSGHARVWLELALDHLERAAR